MGIGNQKKKKRYGRYPEPIPYTDDNVYDKVVEYYKYYYKPNTNDNG